VFHEDFAKDKLSVFLEEWSKADPYFAHLYYWYINSLAPEIDQTRWGNPLREDLLTILEGKKR